jgi:hypothetical protein
MIVILCHVTGATDFAYLRFLFVRLVPFSQLNLLGIFARNLAIYVAYLP